MRKLGLDIGTKSCGIALSDESNLIAQGIENFFFPAGEWLILVKKIQTILINYSIDTIVIGYPTYSSGDKTHTAILIDQFVDLLKTKVTIPIVFINENKTTKKARAIMHQAGMNIKKQKKFKDQVAAQMILNDYLMTLESSKRDKE